MQIFPSTEAEILPQIPILFGGFDRNEKVIRAVLESPAGHRARERGAPEGRATFAKSLAKLTTGMSPTEKRQVVANLPRHLFGAVLGPSPETRRAVRRGRHRGSRVGHESAHPSSSKQTNNP